MTEMELAKKWILSGAIKPRKTINRNASSYGIKHIAERAVGHYISNEALIKAMIECGYKASRIRNTPNFFFNVAFTTPINSDGSY